MTTDRDFDRIARAWLDLMPDEAPDRTVAAVLQAVEAAPQVRRPLRRLPWRFIPMYRIPIAIGAAAIIVAAGALFFARSGSGPNVASSPAPSPTTSPSASPSSPTGSPVGVGGSIPTELRAQWMGDHRDLVAPDAGTTIILDESTFALTQSNAIDIHLLASGASSVGDGLIRLQSTAATDGCSKGDVGIYRWALTPSARTLTITEDSDACVARAGAVAGTWWLMGCTVADDGCLGLLDAGTYKSQYIAPHVDSGGDWSPVFGALTYTVPAGWANGSDWPQTFDLVPSAELSTTTDIDRSKQINLMTQPTAMAQDPPCSDLEAPGVGRTADAIATWLHSVTGMITTAPKAITIDGHPGQWIDVRLDPAWTGTCPQQAQPLVAYLNPGVAISNGERERLILLDLGGGDVIAIAVFVRDQAAFDGFLSEAMPIIESFRFE